MRPVTYTPYIHICTEAYDIHTHSTEKQRKILIVYNNSKHKDTHTQTQRCRLAHRQI